MKIAWLTSALPSAGASGASGIEYELLRDVVRKHSVRLFSLDLPPGELQLTVDGSSVAAEGSCAYFSRPRPPRLLSKGLRRLSLRPVDRSYLTPRLRDLQHVLKHRLEAEHFDLVHISGAELSPFAAEMPAPVVLWVPELLSHRYAKRAGMATNLVERVSWLMERAKAKQCERRWYSSVAGLAVCGGQDSKHLEGALTAAVAARLVGKDDLRTWWHSAAELVAEGERRVGRVTAPSKCGDVTSDGTGASIAVVVCTRERAALLRRSLSAIAAARVEVSDTSLIIVEQGRPTAESICDELQLAATIIPDRGTGAARARNIGVEASSAAIVLFTDDDCLVPLSWVRDHVDGMSLSGAAASLGVVAGLSRTSEEHDPVAWRALHRQGSPPWTLGHSSNMAVRRDAFVSIGGFDQRLGPGARGGFVCEDADFLVRLLESGKTVVSGVGAPVQHVDWRDPAQERQTMLSYQRGNGAWIGKLARRDCDDARFQLRQIMRITRQTRESGFEGSWLAYAANSGAAIARGLIHGYRMEASGRRPRDPACVSRRSMS